MKKIKIFLISLTLLAFSNTASGGFFGDVFKVIFGESDKKSWSNEEHSGVNRVRCMVEYTQLDLATGLEKTVKHTVQYVLMEVYGDYDVMQLSSEDLTKKINIWLNENENNVITNLTAINCKERRFYISKIFFWNNEQRWTNYKSCPDEFCIRLLSLIDRPEQWGYIVNKDRLIKEYEDGCKNYVYEYGSD
jgi:hypothetical protein